jgi:hypothetical protein
MGARSSGTSDGDYTWPQAVPEGQLGASERCSGTCGVVGFNAECWHLVRLKVKCSLLLVNANKCLTCGRELDIMCAL